MKGHINDRKYFPCKVNVLYFFKSTSGIKDKN